MMQPVVRAYALLALKRKSAATPYGRSMMIEHGGESRAAPGGASGSRGVLGKHHTDHASRLKHARYARGPAHDPAAPAPAGEDLRPNCRLTAGFVPNRFSTCAPRGLIITLRELIITVGRVMIMRRAGGRLSGASCAHAASELTGRVGRSRQLPLRAMPARAPRLRGPRSPAGMSTPEMPRLPGGRRGANNLIPRLVTWSPGR
jgi:hypothetical protein